MAILRAQVAHFGVLRSNFALEIFDASLRADGLLVGARDFFRAACQVGAEFVALARVGRLIYPILRIFGFSSPRRCT